MNNITLKKIDESNFLSAFALELGEGQDEFVSHPIRSLAQAYVYRDQCAPFGIYADGRMVGYVMVIYDDDEETYNIWHMMIDRREQGRGFGSAALQRVLAYIAEQPFGDSPRVLLTCSPDNRTAWRLYHRLGFRDSGRRDEDEIELVYEMTGGKPSESDRNKAAL